MKHLSTGFNFIGAIALLALAVGCAGMQAQSKENLLIAAGFKMLVDSGVLDLDYDTGREPTTGALLPYGWRPRWPGNEQVVVDIYRAMVRARSGHVA